MTIKCDKCGREAAVENEADILRLAGEGLWDSKNGFVYCPRCSTRIEENGEALTGYYSTVKTMKEQLKRKKNDEH